MATAFLCEESPRTLVCKKCSTQFDRSPSKGRLPHFCSPECKQAFGRKYESREQFRLIVEARKQEVAVKSQRHKEVMAISAANRIKTRVVCQVSFARKVSTGRDAGLCCSRKCGFEWQAQVRGARHAPKWVVSKAKCRGCGAWFIKANASNVFCLPSCKPKPAPVAPVPRQARQCLECSGSFVPCGPQRLCSPRCRLIRGRRAAIASGAKAAGRKAGKMRLRGVTVESVNPLVVLRRDKWTCQLCGIKTPERLRGSFDDRAPEIDHIMPIARGGEHSYRNVQCACRKCNLAKGSTPRGQTLLFG